MTYDLGIDLGTTSTAAAVLRDGGAHPETVALGSRLAVVPSVVYRGADGTVLVGESAERRAGDEPDRVVREVKRRLGDDVPPVVGGEPWPAEDVAAAIVAWVLARVAEREGGPARRVVVTHPATWGDFRCTRLRTALAGLADVELLAEPHAAVLGHAALRRPVTVGGGAEDAVTTAVYDLGGGTFDAAVARRAADGTVTLLGTPRGLDRVGGIDFDEAVLAHVRAEVADALAELDPDDPESWQALHRLRRDCVEAKEALSADTEVAVPVVLPSGHRTVRLGRADFEARIHDTVAATVEEFGAALADAGVTPTEVDHVLLAGGSSTIPLVARLLTEALGRPVSADADPLTVVALGAAVAARGEAVEDAEVPVRPRGPERPPSTVVALSDAAGSPDADPPRRGRRALVASGVLVAAVAVAVAVPLPLDEAVTDSVRGALHDAFGTPAAALTVPPPPPTVVARPLGEVTPLGPTDPALPGGGPVSGPGPVPPPGTGPVGAAAPAASPAASPAVAPAVATPAAARTAEAPTGPVTVAATPAAATEPDPPSSPVEQAPSDDQPPSEEPEPTGEPDPPAEETRSVEEPSEPSSSAPAPSSGDTEETT
ncbi:Hsp70 protein [Actinomycetospora succinea]|uniref:Hsp70 protein n=1 Tax=Actinomycetospora succinea TaxID=663603 RepID=A0A4R6V1W7_9PSEU|nr:Hsp70 family protein [Actinomycetospora succinea]TDQ53990.1 Hsp70 protein [Actinomycetospora succinea]